MKNSCPICQNDKKFDTIEAKEMFIGLRESFSYQLCLDCHSLFIKEIPNNIHEYYSKYPVFDIKSHENSLRQFIRRYIILNQNVIARLFLKFLNSWEDLAYKSLHGIKLKKTMRILDVGCGNGALITALKKFGFQDLTGIDPYLKKSSELPGLRLLKCNIDDLSECFDIIMCHHSFEHFDNLYKKARQLDRLTKPGGLLIIRIPNIESYSFRKYKESWHGIHAPFHFFLPSFRGMEQIFKETNFELEAKRGEQLVELFLYNINISLNIGLMEPLGILSFLGDGPIGRKIPPLFTRHEIAYLKEKSTSVLKCNMADYVGYYFRKKG